MLYITAIILKNKKMGLLRLQRGPDGLRSILLTCEGTGRTPWIRVVPDKLLVDKLVKKFLDFSGTPESLLLLQELTKNVSL